MTEERREELLNNMLEYLGNYNSVDFDAIGASEETSTEEAYNNCLDYIVELVGNEGNEYFFIEVLGFTEEELLDEGMEWIYN